MTGESEPARFAVVGAGAISQVVHVPILAEREDVTLVALADIDEPKARTVADRFGVPEVTSADEVLGRDDIEGVVLSTPNHLHEEMALQALESGKHVLVERPLALTADGVRRVLDAAEKAGTCLSVGMPHRFRPEVSALRSFVAGAELGDIYAIRASWLTRARPSMRPSWRDEGEKAGGGALMDLGVPALDLSLWLVDYPEVTRLRCVTSSVQGDLEDAATLMAETADGAVLTVEVSARYFAGEDRFYARVMGSEGSGSLPPLEVYRQLGGRPLDVTPRQPRPRGGENPYTNAYRRQIDHFVRGMQGVGEVEMPHEHVALMEVIQMAYRAAEEGREVER